MKRFSMLWVLVLALTTSLFAEVSEPIFKMSFRSYNQFLGDMKFIGEVASDPAFGTAVELPLQLWLGADFLESLDKNAPIGLCVQHVADSYQPLLVLPVDDLTAVTDLLSQKVFLDSEVEMNQGEDGVMEFRSGASTLYLKTVGTQTFLATTREQIDHLPKETFLDKTDDTFSLTFDMENLPQEVKDEFLKAFDMGLTLSMEQLPEESDEDFAARKEQGEAGAEMMRQLFEQYQTLSIGVRMNRDTKAMEWNLDIQFLPDASLLKTIQKQRDVTPAFTGFAGKGLLYGGHMVSFQDPKMAQTQKKSLKNTFQTLQTYLSSASVTDDAKTRDHFTRAANLVKELLGPYLEKESYRMGLGVQLDANARNFGMGIDSDDPAQFQKAFDELIQMARDELGDTFQESWIHKNVETVDGVTFSTCVFPLKDLALSNQERSDDWKEKTLAFYGDQLVLALGQGKNCVYLGVGNDPLPLLKTCLKETGNTAPMYQEMSLLPLFAFLSRLTELEVLDSSSTEDTREKTQGILTLLSEIVADASDKITVQYDYTDKGLKTRLILEEGCVRLIGSARSIYTIMAL
ncbi:MAG: hypothetical protein Q4D98_13170 [Planctomycetia bacterium]|nr:hypothetical protein [Planctomycetia bacterium]